MTNFSSKALSILLMILGALNIFIGLNIAFGGILTLGWQGQTKFFEITNEHAYLLQDSHIRFFGGLYLAVGLFLILAATNLRKYQTALYLVFFIIFIGGLARFTMGRSDIIFGKAIIGSLFAEIILMPVFFLWLLKLMKPK
jgi:hypothetical protein